MPATWGVPTEEYNSGTGTSASVTTAAPAGAYMVLTMMYVASVGDPNLAPTITTESTDSVYGVTGPVTWRVRSYPIPSYSGAASVAWTFPTTRWWKAVVTWWAYPTGAESPVTRVEDNYDDVYDAGGYELGIAPASTYTQSLGYAVLAAVDASVGITVTEDDLTTFTALTERQVAWSTGLSAKPSSDNSWLKVYYDDGPGTIGITATPEGGIDGAVLYMFILEPTVLPSTLNQPKRRKSRKAFVRDLPYQVTSKMYDRELV